MKSFFNEYSQVLVVIIVAIALIAICMGLKVAFGDSLTDLANNFTNKAQEVLEFDDDNSGSTPIGNDNYVGYYADIDNNGIVDGVIFFDYTQGADTTSGFLGNGVAVSSKTEGLATYTLKTVDGKDNVVVKTGDGDDRFYVIALENSKPASGHATAYLYCSAYESKVSDYASIAPTGFGKGKTNTATMKTKWGAETYGTKDNRDVFTIDMGNWFIPSKDEWSVLGSELKKVATGSYSTMTFESGASLNFSFAYLSSSFYSNQTIWYSAMQSGSMNIANLNDSRYVRLATTF